VGSYDILWWYNMPLTNEQLEFIERYTEKPFQEKVIKKVEEGGLSDCYIFTNSAYEEYDVLGYDEHDFPYVLARSKSKSYAKKLLKKALELGICRNVYRYSRSYRYRL